MFSRKQWIMLDLILAILILVVLLNLAGIKVPSLGQALSALDQQPFLCRAEWQGQQSTVSDLAYCCRDAQTLGCSKQKKEWHCGTANTIQYHLNNKAYYLCKDFWNS